MAKGLLFYSGKGIQDIRRTSGTGAAGTTDTYTIFYTDKSVSAFGVRHGSNGLPGPAPDLTAYSTKAQADLLYKPIGWTPDLSAYATKLQSDGLYLGISAQAYDSARFGGQLPSYYQTALGFTPYNANNPAGYITAASIPTSLPASDVYAWAKASTKPTYDYSELTNKPIIPTAYILPISTATVLGGVKIGSGVSVDANGVISVSTNYVTGTPWTSMGYLTTITSSQVTTALGYKPVHQGGGINQTTNDVYIGWSTVGKVKVTIDSTDIGNILFEGRGNSFLTNDSGYITAASIPTSLPASDVYAWAKSPTKPSYTYSEVGAAPSSTISFPGFGTSHTTSAYGDHSHTGIYQPVGSYLTTETDPIFNAWNKSSGISITKSQISDFPTSLPANGGTSSQVVISYNQASNANYQLLWGNGNYIYGNSNIYCNPYTGNLIANQFNANNESGTLFSATNTVGGYCHIGVTSNATSEGFINFTNTLRLNGAPVIISSTVQSTLPTNGSLVVVGGIGAASSTFGDNSTPPIRWGSTTTIYGMLDWFSAGYAAIYGNTGKGLYLGANGSLNMFNIYTNGNHSIGYAADQGYKLSVNGTGYFNGNITASGYKTSRNSSSYIIATDGSDVLLSSIGNGVNEDQTTVYASGNGSIICSQPFRAGTYKKVMLRLVACNGSATYVFPSAFNYSNVVISSAAGATVTLNSNSVLINTAYAVSGLVIIEGY